MSHHQSLLQVGLKKTKSTSPNTNQLLTTQNNQTYYSTCQANFFKVYATQTEFLKKIENLLQSIQRRKINKVVNQIKLSNRIFKKYLSEMRITNLKIQDIIKFQEMTQRQTVNQMKRSSVGNLGLNTKSSLLNKQNKQREAQMIKKGFMSLIQQLQTLKKQEFVNETKYLQGILLRETSKLKNYGYDFLFDYKQKNCNMITQLQKEQKTFGLYPLIMGNIRDETTALNKIVKKFEFMVSKH